MKLGVIGCGKMGRALVGGIIGAGISRPEDVTVFYTFPEAATSVSKDLHVHLASGNAEVVDRSDVILLCVKPQGFAEMLQDLGNSRDKLLISIAAGIRLSSIESGCGENHRVIRVMPNTPALIGKGASAYSLGSTATEADAMLSAGEIVCVLVVLVCSRDKLLAK